MSIAYWNWISNVLVYHSYCYEMHNWKWNVVSGLLSRWNDNQVQESLMVVVMISYEFVGYMPWSFCFIDGNAINKRYRISCNCLLWNGGSWSHGMLPRLLTLKFLHMIAHCIPFTLSYYLGKGWSMPDYGEPTWTPTLWTKTLWSVPVVNTSICIRR